MLSCTLFIRIQAHDFISIVDGQTLYFSITDSVSNTAKVTYSGKASESSSVKSYKGLVTIPVRVTVKGVSYRITSIGTKAFCNSPELTGVIIPGGVTEIGDFAFDGCMGLESVVFPGNEVNIGEGAFFRCPSISRITIGSDWTSVNLKVFCWSQKLEEIAIPAKVRQIRNFKSLLYLKKVSVDPNNPYYKSIDGLLYSADGKSFLAAPRAVEGRVVIQDGTMCILKGALADCYNLKEIELPSSLTSLSYSEFTELNCLEKVIFHGLQPINTATADGKPVFILMVSSNTKIVVPRKALMNYKKTILSKRGEYSELRSGQSSDFESDINYVTVIVHDGDLAKSTAIYGDKKLNP